MHVDAKVLDHLLASAATQEGVVVVDVDTNGIVRRNAYFDKLCEDAGTDVMTRLVGTCHPEDSPRDVVLDRISGCPAEQVLAGLDKVELEIFTHRIGDKWKLVSLKRLPVYEYLLEQVSALQHMVDAIDTGLVLYRLDAVGGSSRAVCLNKALTRLSGAVPEQIFEIGIPAVAMRCHPDDLPVSDLVAMHAVARLGSCEWPVRMFYNGEYIWRQYTCHTHSLDGGKSVIMVCTLIDFSREAERMGLRATPSVKEIQTAEGTVLIPVMLSDHSYSDRSESVAPAGDHFDMSSVDTRATTGAQQDSGSRCNHQCSGVHLKRKLMGYLASALREEGWEGEFRSLSKFKLDLDGLKEEVLLRAPREVQSALKRAIEGCNFVYASQLLADFVGADSGWLLQGPSAAAMKGPPEDVLLVFELLLGMADLVATDAEALILIQHLAARLGDVSQRIGEFAGSALAMLLALALVRLSLKHQGAFSARPIKAWIGTCVSLAVSGLDESSDPIMLLCMYWLSIQWALVVGRPEVLVSCLDDMAHFQQAYPESSNVGQLRQAAELNLAVFEKLQKRSISQ